MSSTLPLFHQQFYRTYGLLALALVILLLSGFGLLKIREYHFQQHLGQQLPQLKLASEQLTLVRQAEQMLIVLTEHTGGEGFIEAHQQLEKSLLLLTRTDKALTLAQFPYLAKQADANQIIRIAGKDTLNRHIIDKAQTILNQTISQLTALINEKSKAFGGFATANVERQLQEYKLALNTLKVISSQLSLLNLQAPELLVEQLDQLTEQVMLWFNTAEPELAREANPIVESFVRLKQVLLIDERLIAKWRGHLRIYRQYQQLATEQQTDLIQLAKNLSNSINSAAPKANIRQFLPSWIAQSADKLNLNLSYQGLFISLITLMVFALLLMVLVVFKLHRKLQHSAQQELKLIKQCLDKKQDISEITPLTQEQRDIFQCLAEVVKPEITLAEHQQINQQHQQLLNVIAKAYQVFVWQLDKHSDNHAVKEFLTAHFHHPISNSLLSLRGLFSSADLQALFKAAKTAKASQQFQQLTLNVANKTVLINLAYLEKEQRYYGVIAFHQGQESDTESAVASEITALHTQQLVDKAKLSEAMNNRVIQAMLQSQAECLTRKSDISSLYRQLNRMLVWGQEHYLLHQISQSDFKLSLQHTILQTQILTVLANLTNDLKGLKNRYQFSDKLPAQLEIETDLSLFNATFAAIARVMVTRQRNSQLMLSAQLIDTNNGQYITQYQFWLTSEHKTPLPVELAVFVDNAIVRNETEEGVLGVQSATLIEVLLTKLFASDIAVQEHETGYQFSFTLPHTKVKQHKTAVDLDLQQKSVVYLSEQQLAEPLEVDDQLVLDSLSSAQVNLIQVSWPQLPALLQPEQLKLKPIQAIVCRNLHLFNQLNPLITAVPEPLKPCLYMLTGKAHLSASIEYGCFNSSIYPFNKYAFLSDLALHIAQNRVNNLAISTAELTAQQYVCTGVEILLACAQYNHYSVLVQTLNYLGFNVTLVNSDLEMLALWRSGRFLILMSEFAISPTLELDNGKQVQRGLIALKPELLSLWQSEKSHQHWRFSQLSFSPQDNTFNLAELQSLLASWLVIKELEKPPVVMPQLNTPVKPVIENNVAFEALPAAFNLDKFAQHQAGPENAVLMLDDYIAELNQLSRKLAFSLSIKSTNHSFEFVDKITQLAKILSAEEVVNTVTAIARLLAENNFQACQTLTAKLQTEIQLVEQYAEAI